VSEQEPSRVSDNLGDIVGAEPSASSSPDATPVEAAPGPAKESISIESKIVPERDLADQAKDAAKAETAKADPPQIDAKPSASPGQILIMAPEKAWGGDRVEHDTGSSKPGIFGKRRVAALAAVVALAAVAGALGGALAAASLGRSGDDAAKVANNHALEESISRIDTEIAALRTSLEQASKHTAGQLSKSSDRLDKIEKAQAEPAAKLARLSEAMDKLRTAAAAPSPGPAVAASPAPATAPSAAPALVAAAPVPKETTATIQTANAAPGQVPLPAPKPEVGRLPTVEGWVLRDVANGSALIEGRQGIFEVYAGDQIPGLGRVDAVRKQDGRWVVITSRGLIVGR
jgi:hypothetical protein